MTFVLSIQGRETLWLVADRRLSSRGKPVKDDARKVMVLQGVGDRAILGYAGLGATASGTQPADWMSAVLRGRGLNLEQSLGVIADAMKREFPRHMGGRAFSPCDRPGLRQRPAPPLHDRSREGWQKTLV